LRAIELLHQEMPEAAVFAIGSMTQPQLIVNAMRAGAREYIERPTTTTDLLEAFVRLSAAQRKGRREGKRGKVFTVINAKGGSGATTVAVNLALALQNAHGNSALMDLAPLGHAALHLNMKGQFTVNSSRLDAATRLACNLAETVLLVAHADVASLWSAARVVQYVGDAGGRERVRLVLNRFRKIPGFSEEDAEAAAGIKLIWRIPNQYFAVSTAIDRGIPPMQQGHTEIARSFAGLAAALTQDDDEVKRTTWSLFKTV
jgi:Flp pilus assembly CpaE family ATPase